MCVYMFSSCKENVEEPTVDLRNPRNREFNFFSYGVFFIFSLDEVNRCWLCLKILIITKHRYVRKWGDECTWNNLLDDLYTCGSSSSIYIGNPEFDNITGKIKIF